MNDDQAGMIKEIVCDVARAHCERGDGLAEAHVLPDKDMRGENIVRVVAVFENENPSVGAGAKTQLAGRLWDALRGEGLDHIPVIYFMGRSEWRRCKDDLGLVLSQDG